MVYNIRKQIGIVGHAQNVEEGKKVRLYKFLPPFFQVFFQMGVTRSFCLGVSAPWLDGKFHGVPLPVVVFPHEGGHILRVVAIRKLHGKGIIPGGERLALFRNIKGQFRCPAHGEGSSDAVIGEVIFQGLPLLGGGIFLFQERFAELKISKLLPAGLGTHNGDDIIRLGNRERQPPVLEVNAVSVFVVGIAIRHDVAAAIDD